MTHKRCTGTAPGYRGSVSCQIILPVCLYSPADIDAHEPGTRKHQRKKQRADMPSVRKRRLEKACGQTPTPWQTVQVAEP